MPKSSTDPASQEPRQHPNNQPPLFPHTLLTPWCELELLIGFNLVQLDTQKVAEYDDILSLRKRIS